MPPAKKTRRKSAAAKKSGFSAEERAAMKARIKELNADGDGETQLLAAIAAMPEPDRAMAARLHAIIKANAPTLSPKTWYGMPAWARDGNVVCFFQGGYRFKARYATFGFSDKAKLDEGNMWPAGFALVKLTAPEEAKIAALLKKALR